MLSENVHYSNEELPSWTMEKDGERLRECDNRQEYIVIVVVVVIIIVITPRRMSRKFNDGNSTPLTFSFLIASFCLLSFSVFLCRFSIKFLSDRILSL